jgi:hypothetical protein
MPAWRSEKNRLASNAPLPGKRRFPKAGTRLRRNGARNNDGAELGIGEREIYFPLRKVIDFRAFVQDTISPRTRFYTFTPRH